MTAVPSSLAAAPRSRWLFSAPVDLCAFLGSAVVALLLLPLGAELGVLYGDAPEWTWVTIVLLLDVAHVWSTIFRVYLDRGEFVRRRRLYLFVPAAAYLLGVALYSESPALFWRVLAYMAVFHFIRQQYGWVVLYRARAGERAARWFDAAVIYAATVYPLLYWHAHLPRAFWWFVPGDFADTSSFLVSVASVVEPVYWGLLAAYLLRAGVLWIGQGLSRGGARRFTLAGARGLAAWAGRFNPGKDIVVFTTAACWYIGIVALNSDYAFTVTNVIIHGVPYFVLIYWYGRRRAQAGSEAGLVAAIFRRGPWIFLLLVWSLAFIEELVWDRAVWHERVWLFGASWDAEAIHMWLVPCLAVPQATHYILDGFIWRRRQNPDFDQAGAFARQ